ncbi:helix-turn-helix transcriptional regulator [Paludibacterium sp.]|uniref:helix-turn-helix transcriptional regulator n=1 Tax=Paludibacterium sp. TaxID=1917523 RepID=UPI001D3CE763|nr:helix-turn-helix transcriptional regulator [Paludibacterium sp.]MBV8059898.1 helix-turn-helix transcriptional regulator [Alphaproteobacteria bacterium]MBV8646012.1 helix-turn-helix transcriptional regulator [Paludibacterium sp.]
MVTLLQIRAARTLLGWTQDALAEAAGVSLPSINNLERGVYSPRPDTYQAIVTALEKGGVEFIPGNGLRLRQDDHEVTTFSGSDFLCELETDILLVLKGPEDEIVGCSSDERKWMEYCATLNPVYYTMQRQKRWRQRTLIPNNADFISNSPEIYRTVSAEVIGNMTYRVYGNRLALIEWSAMRVTLIRNSQIADMFRGQFDALWTLAKPITAKHLKKIERFDNTRKYSQSVEAISGCFKNA